MKRTIVNDELKLQLQVLRQQLLQQQQQQSQLELASHTSANRHRDSVASSTTSPANTASALAARTLHSKVTIPRVVVDTTTPVDVLCGRGKVCFDHPGNNSFRLLIAEHADTYQMAPVKKMKMQVVMLIVDIIMARGGRFLGKFSENRDTGEITWADGGRKQGRKKTGHAFRDALRGRVKCMTKIMSAYQRSDTTLTSSSTVSAATRGMTVLLSSSSSSSSSGEDEMDEDYLFAGKLSASDPTPLGVEFQNIEPSREWRNSKMDQITADELLDFVIAEQEFEDGEEEATASSSSSPNKKEERKKGGGSRAA